MRKENAMAPEETSQAIPPNPQQISEMLNALLSNREMMENLKKWIPQQGKNDAPHPETNPHLPAGGLDTVLSNPALMAALPTVMAQLAPMMSGVGGIKEPAPKKKSPEECRNDLLCALRPFLSADRQNAIDTLIRISALGTLIRQMK
jgi:hypothetical protein